LFARFRERRSPPSGNALGGHFKMRIIVIALVAMLFGPIVVVAIQQADVPKFRYELPEGFAGWACVDFGIATGAPLERDADGVYIVEPVDGQSIRA